MAKNTLPTIPFKSKVLNNLNFFSEPWTKFLVLVYQKLGGSTPTSSLSELENRIDLIAQGPNL